MAAYAAVVSLMNTLDNVQVHHRFSNSLDKKQVESLGEKLDFLLEFIETTTTTTHSQSDEETQVLLESQIASAAFAAEDVIESHIVDQIHTGSLSLLDLETVIQDMDSVKEKVVIAKEQRGFKDYVQPTHTTTSFSTSSSTKCRMVGLDDKLIQLMDELTGHQSTLKIIPIAGMGGIGKTTLARNAYENQLIVQHFDIRAWVTVSQKYTVRDIFSILLSCYFKGDFDRESENQLEGRLYRSLIGRRYLIMLDDIWSLEAWDRIKRFFPNNNNRSRVVVTTRLSSIATHFGTSSFQLGLLDEDKSWQLFCENTFLGDVCPRELEAIGKKIIKKCKGLPLLIVVIGALLRKSSVECWENISKNIHSVSSIGEEESLDVLSLSYNHLPAHLKPCFLYMGTFPEDERIIVSQLIKLWVAEGFVKPSKTQSLEEVAKGYLKDLIDRNLILVRRNWLNGDIERCSIHDLLRDLCLEKARKENFLCVMRVDNFGRGIDTESCFVFNQGRVSKHFHGLNEEYRLESAFLVRSLASNGDSRFKMLRVLNAPGSNYGVDYMLKQVNLRYISIQYCFLYNRIIFGRPFHLSISLLWNLQTLIVSDVWLKIVAPCEIWEMPQLRHVEITKSVWLPDPPSLSNQHDHEFVMRNLQTLGRVFNLTEEVCKRISNVKRLQVIYEFERDNWRSLVSYDFGRLNKLESLHCQFDEKQSLSRVGLLQNLIFPSSLQELSLGRCYLHWEDLTMIGSLPHLRVLQLERNSVMGSEWNSVDGEFLRLRCLKLVYCNGLINWNADKSHFPLLEKLVLEGLLNLNEIPSDFGEIQTLCEIRLYKCSETSSISAVKILDEQESFGNQGLRVLIGFWEREEVESFKEKIEQFESSTSNNLQLFSTE